LLHFSTNMVTKNSYPKWFSQVNRRKLFSICVANIRKLFAHSPHSTGAQKLPWRTFIFRDDQILP
jgi:hypothetical protein